MLGDEFVKVTNPMLPYLPYHVKIMNNHRVIYFKTLDNLHYEYFDWFTNQSYGVGNLAQGLPNER